MATNKAFFSHLRVFFHLIYNTFLIKNTRKERKKGRYHYSDFREAFRERILRDHRNATPWTVTGCARKRESLKQGAVGRILALTVAVREPRSVYLPPQTPKPQIGREPCLDLDAKENKGA